MTQLTSPGVALYDIDSYDPGFPHPYDQLIQFEDTFNTGKRADAPTLPAKTTEEGFRIRSLRKALLEEEYEEYLDAEHEDDLVGIADALADIIYIAYGTGVLYGLPMDEIFYEVHRSNMSKADENGKPIFRADGKLLKSDRYTPPAIAEIIKNASENKA